MTAQINDVFKFNGEEYYVVGIDGPELFDPVKEGFNPKVASTACWRGFYLTFEATETQMTMAGAIVYSVMDDLSLKQYKEGRFLVYKYEYENFSYKKVIEQTR